MQTVVQPITDFVGEHAFLSNFAPSPFMARGCNGQEGIMQLGVLEWPTAEHYFQAQKAASPVQFEEIRHASTPGHAKRLGRKVELVRGWERAKTNVMLLALEAKFMQNADLARQLAETWPHALVEGNSWGDRYWGAVLRENNDTIWPGERIWAQRGGYFWVGHNWLGRLLELVREQSREPAGTKA